MIKNTLLLLFALLWFSSGLAQIQLRANVELKAESPRELHVKSEIILPADYPLDSLYLYDWNHAFSSTSTPLGQRFSDEFVRSFYYADDKERSFTHLQTTTLNRQNQSIERVPNHPDLLRIAIPDNLAKPITIQLDYTLQLPHARFGRYGYTDQGAYFLHHFLVRPAKITNGQPVLYSNANLDDARYEPIDLTLQFDVPESVAISSNLPSQSLLEQQLTANEKTWFSDLSVEISPREQSTWRDFTFGSTTIRANFHPKKLEDWQHAYSLTQLVQFTESLIGQHPTGLVWVSQAEYQRNPFYGLNQLPAFLRPFEEQFLFEVQFLKAYLRAYTRTAFDIDFRTENALTEGLQMYILRKYVETYYPDAKLIGRLNKWWILQGFYFTHLDFNQQYTYYSQLMARKNLDQPLGTAKDDLLKFNQQIANPYHAGLYFHYMEAYLGKSQFLPLLKHTAETAKKGQFQRAQWQYALESTSQKKWDWFFNDVYQTRNVIDYRLQNVRTKGDSTYVSIRNMGGIEAPITLFRLNDKTITQRQWISGFSGDSTFVFSNDLGKDWALNLDNSAPEFNQKDNWFRQGHLLNRPINVTFMKDVEYPNVQQLLWVPNFEYNLYDGFSPGLRLHNRTVLDKRFTFDITPTYSIKTGQPIGSGTLVYNHYRRHSNWYYTRFSVSGNYFHYAPEATYTRWNPMIQWRYRPEDLRKNTRHLATLRYVMVDRQTSPLALDDYKEPNYNVVNFRWAYGHDEIQESKGLTLDNQWSPKFTKQQLTAQYSSFFAPNRQWGVRLYAGVFWHNATQSDFFSFGATRPSDYLFDHNYYGRSEDTGLFSQQYIKSEGALKSIRTAAFANHWMTSVNSSFTIWNWIEAFGDVAWYANRGQRAEFAYDAGIRFNLVPDYFELYFPVYNENGWVGEQGDYSKQVRFVLTIDPKTLINLATRRWW